jgi:hypothetical protein
MRLYPQVGFSVARRTIRARRLAGMAGRPGRTGWVVQRRATSWRCQRRMVAGVTSSPRRRWTGEQSGEGGDQGAVGPRYSRAWRAPLEHGELVAQDQDLDVLGGVGSGAQHDPAQELGEHLVGQSQRHQGIMPASCRGRTGRSRAVCIDSGTHTFSCLPDIALRRRELLRWLSPGGPSRSAAPLPTAPGPARADGGGAAWADASDRVGMPPGLREDVVPVDVRVAPEP